MAIFNLAILLISLVALAYCGNLTIKYATKLASFFKLHEFIVGFLILGLGTALPDLFVTSIAALRGNMNLVLGSIIGTNIVNMTLMLGMVTLVRGNLPIKSKTMLEDFGWIFFALTIPIFFLMDGLLNVGEGVVLIVVYLMFLYNIETKKVRFPKSPYAGDKHFVKHTMLLLASLIGVVFFANLVVDNALLISRDLGVSEIYMGFTMIAFGMALPELTTELAAANEKKDSLVWGDFIGSYVTNLSLVLGIVGLFNPPSFNFQLFQLGYVFMGMSFLMVFFFTRSDRALDKGEGLALILIYVVFLMVGAQMFSVF